MLALPGKYHRLADVELHCRRPKLSPRRYRLNKLVKITTTVKVFQARADIKPQRKPKSDYGLAPAYHARVTQGPFLP
jgi:hypothetical protein